MNTRPPAFAALLSALRLAPTRRKAPPPSHAAATCPLPPAGLRARWESGPLLGLGAVVCASLAVAGCGFHPMYGGGKLGPELASIYVEPMPERDGYELRNQLIDLLGSDGHEAGKSYFLKLTLTQASNGVALENNATITRYNDTLTAAYVLTDAEGKQVTSGSQTSLASYNVSNEPYSTLSVQQDSDRRAAQDLADRIRVDLGAFFSGRR